MRKIGLLILALIAFSNVNAGVMLEPYIGVGVLGAGDSTVNSNVYTHEPGGVTFGGRVGYQFLGFMGGLDYSMNSGSMTSKVLLTEFEDDVERTNMGVFVGYNLPVMLRVWASYYLSSTLEGTSTSSSGNYLFRSSNANDLSKATGSGIALGVGLTTLPLVSLNLEYRSVTFDEYENKNGVALTGVTEDVNLSEILLSASLPWEF